MAREQFSGVVLDGHKGAAVQMPFDPAARWGIAAGPLRPGRRGHRVRGSLNGTAFESAIVPRSRAFWLLLDDAVLGAAGVAVGDTVRVAIEPAGRTGGKG
jgi:hypothetical protein